MNKRKTDCLCIFSEHTSPKLTALKTLRVNVEKYTVHGPSPALSIALVMFLGNPAPIKSLPAGLSSEAKRSQDQQD